MAAVTTPQARQAVPHGAASIELIAICALLEPGDLDAAEQRSQRMRRRRAATLSPWTRPAAGSRASEPCCSRPRPPPEQLSVTLLMVIFVPPGPPRAIPTSPSRAGCISTRTVQTHLAHIYATLGINRRADLTSHLK